MSAPPSPPSFDAGGLERFEGELESPLLARVLAFVREEKDPGFAFLRRPRLPWAPLARPLARARVALLSTGALHLRGDAPFRAMEEPYGDTGFRVVPHLAPPAELDLDAPYLDPKYTVRDPEVALPMGALEELARRGRIGAAAPRHYSFCGGVLRPFPGLRESLARVLPLLAEDAVDAVVLIPTCSLCVHTVALLAGEVEERGLPTVALSLLPELSRIVRVPRTLALRFPFGAPCGDPGNAPLHAAVLEEALGLLESAAPGEVQSSTLAWRRPPEPG